MDASRHADSTGRITTAYPGIQPAQEAVNSAKFEIETDWDLR